MDINAQILEAFQVEHKEHVEAIRSILQRMERGGGAEHPEWLDDAFRMAHSLKGGARICDLRALETLGHRMESVFDELRDGRLPLTAGVAQTLYQALDGFEDYMAVLAQKGRPDDPVSALASIENLLGGDAGVGSSQKVDECGPSHRPEVEVSVATQEPVGTESPPEVPPAYHRESPAPMAESTAAVLVDTPVEETLGSRKPSSFGTLRVRTQHLDNVLLSADELMSESVRQRHVTTELRTLGEQVHVLAEDWELARRVSAASIHRLNTMPEFAHLARFLGHLDDQIRQLGRRERQVRILQERCAWSLESLGEQLQRDVRMARMVTAESVYQGFRRMVRQLAAEEGKQVDFQLTGLEVQADRMVLEALKDPLMHMLRNSVAHGVESEEERVRQGKAKECRITLDLQSMGNRLLVAIEDDGRGIDWRRIRDEAVRSGIVDEKQAREMPAEEQSRLAFQPGLSTSRQVSVLAGRGMGLSIVQETVAKLQGDVGIESREGKGTRIHFSVPISLSSHRILLVSSGADLFGIPVHSVDRLVRIRTDQLETIEGRPIVMVEGKPVPFVPLVGLLRRGEPVELPRDTAMTVVVVHSATKKVAVGVDTVFAERDTLIKDLTGPAGRVTGLAGGLITEDDTVAPVLNPAELLNGLSRSAQRFTTVSEPGNREDEVPKILIVDDSFTTRTLEKSILEAHGYQVQVAIDGMEALLRLRSERFDLVISDVQMPRMDGLQLLDELKKDSQFAKLPVILVTSMERREDQEKGLRLGASAYITKQKFDHQELLNVIRRHL